MSHIDLAERQRRAARLRIAQLVALRRATASTATERAVREEKSSA